MIVPSIGTCKARISFNQFLWASNYERTRIEPGEKSDEIILIGAVPDPDCKLRSTFNPQGPHGIMGTVRLRNCLGWASLTEGTGTWRERWKHVTKRRPGSTK